MKSRGDERDTEEKYLSNGQTFSERFKNKMREKFKGLPSYPTLKCYLKAYVFKMVAYILQGIGLVDDFFFSPLTFYSGGCHIVLFVIFYNTCFHMTQLSRV